ncbi:MAG: hypothetical protein IKY54_02135 [Muribaculaceae bacterium]|nr:hypothetical protein [Muribaculaceae bacterium]
MKRLFFIVILLLATVFKGISAYPIYKDKGKIIRGDLHFYIDYTDTLKQEVEKYRVWYEPKEYSDYFNGKEYISELSVYMNGIDFGNLLAGVEYLAISCFGEEKVFNKEGEPNIYRVEFSFYALTGRVYLRYIYFKGGAYNLITDKEILSFIEKFNSHIKVNVSNKKNFSDKSFVDSYPLNLFTPNGIYPIKKSK